MSSTELLVTNSRMVTFHTCQRLHHFRYNQGYRPIDDSEALEFGTAFHAALDAWWRAFSSPGTSPLASAQEALAVALAKTVNLDAMAIAKAELLLVGYDARWSFATRDEYELIASEAAFKAPLDGPNGISIAGKIDKLVRRKADNTVWTVEHKTTGSDLAAGSTYWQRLRMDSQISLYFAGAKALGHEIAGCLYDVIRKPELRPLKATPSELRKYLKGTRTLYANQREFDESMGEFKQRMAEAISDEPDKYFARNEIFRLDSELQAAWADTRQTADQIYESTLQPTAPRNPNACFQYGAGHVCAFYDICSGQGSLTEERFLKVKDVHPELST